MAAGGGRSDRRTGRGTDRSGRGLGVDRSAFLAVALTVVMLLSLLAVPVGGAPPERSGPTSDAGSNGADGAGNGNSGNGGSDGTSDGGEGGESADSADGDDGDDGGDGESEGDAGEDDDSDAPDTDDEGEESEGTADDDSGEKGDGDSGEAESHADSGSNPGAGENGGDGGAADSPDNAGGDGGALEHSNAGGDGDDGGSGGPPGHAHGGGKDRVSGGPAGEAGPPEQANAGGKGDGNGDAGPPEHANGESRGDGPSVSVSAGRPAGDRSGDGPPGRSGGGPPPSVVEVSVSGAEAGDDVDLDVAPPAVENDAVAFEGISVTVKRDGDFTMRVTNSREALPGSPSFDPDEDAESLGRIRLDHSITNEEVEDVSYTFRVSKAHLRETGDDFEDVALYRHEDGEWNELPTDVVGETATHYVLSADSPGMSEFAVGAKRPAFDTYWADVDDVTVDDGQSVTVSGRVTNHGGADGVYDARLVVDGEVVEERSVTIAAGGTRQVNFRTTMDRPGVRRISINGVPAGEVTVDARPADSSASGADGGLAVVFDRLLDVGHALDLVPSTTEDT